MFLAAMLISAPGMASAQPRLAEIFTDHAVLQRDKPVRVWGTADAGAAITLSVAGQSQTAQADGQGRWSVTLSPLPAGGPYVLTARDAAGREARIKDVMLGDVFLCGGQSNMSHLVKYATDAAAQLRAPVEPGIRFVTIPRQERALPQERIGMLTQWQVSTPETRGDASAVCYFMARALHQQKKVPVGMIRSSLGGTKVQSWLSPEALQALPPYGERVAALRAHDQSPERGRALWQAHVARWWSTIDPELRGAGWEAPSHDDSGWRRAVLPGGAEADDGMPGYFSGTIWYRHVLTLDARQARNATQLNLGAIGGDATLWINGRQVDAREAGRSDPIALPKGALRAGRNVIALRLLDHGAFWSTRVCAAGCSIAQAAGDPIALAPEWLFQVASPLYRLPLAPRAPWLAGNGLGTLYNAMIAPIAGYGLKAVAWYQGEADVNDPVDYRRTLPALIADWRRTFADNKLPFVIVQLTAYNRVATKPDRSDWAELREVQRQVALTTPDTAMIVTIDAGDRWDIHPTQKKVIGDRAARAMRGVAYGEAITPGGPRPIGAEREGEDIVVRFGDTDGGLITLSADRAIGFELCDAAGQCRYADARVDGDRVILPGGNRDRPASIRYAWANTPVVNLYGGGEIPAAPFEIAIKQ
jgi:sialate O-acetylesterase